MTDSFADLLGWIPKSQNLRESLSRAYHYAEEQGHRHVTIEHLLLALTEDPDSITVLVASQVNLDKLRDEIAGFVSRIPDRLPVDIEAPPFASDELGQIFDYASAAAEQSKRQRIDGAIVLAALVGEGKSPAAELLRQHGVTFEGAIRTLQTRKIPPVEDSGANYPSAGPVERPNSQTPAASKPAGAAPRAQAGSQSRGPESRGPETRGPETRGPEHRLPDHRVPERRLADDQTLQYQTIDGPVLERGSLDRRLSDAQPRQRPGGQGPGGQEPGDQGPGVLEPGNRDRGRDFARLDTTRRPPAEAGPLRDLPNSGSPSTELANGSRGQQQPRFAPSPAGQATGRGQADSRGGAQLGAETAADAAGRLERRRDAGESHAADTAHQAGHAASAAHRRPPASESGTSHRPAPPPRPTHPAAAGMAAGAGQAGIRTAPHAGQNASGHPGQARPAGASAAPVPPAGGRPGAAPMRGAQPLQPHPAPHLAPHAANSASGPGGLPAARPAPAPGNRPGPPPPVGMPAPAGMPGPARATGHTSPHAHPHAPGPAQGQAPGQQARQPGRAGPGHPAQGPAGSTPTRQAQAGPAAAPSARDAGRERAFVESGVLVENIPRRMRVGVPEQAEIRIARREVAAMLQGLSGRGSVESHEVLVTQAMSVRLRSPDSSFWIEAGAQETQWVENQFGYEQDDFARWRYTITPKRKGTGVLQVLVAARTAGGDGISADAPLPDQVIEVRVRTNYGALGRQVAIWGAAAVAGGMLGRYGERAMDLLGWAL